jgi:ribonuclease P protein component
VPGDDAGCRLAFAVPRRVGTAVVRNRVRRRLRAGFAELAAAGAVPSGTYLLGVGPEATVHDGATLLGHLRAALDRSGAR